MKDLVQEMDPALTEEQEQEWLEAALSVFVRDARREIVPLRPYPAHARTIYASVPRGDLRLDCQASLTSLFHTVGKISEI